MSVAVLMAVAMAVLTSRALFLGGTAASVLSFGGIRGEKVQEP
ncbi:hypothetical protein [Streptomyces sp. NRRL S-920]|nr:hypothetical protein [Streptomyces sp. NRRL S-920]